MSIVIDASVALKWVEDEPGSDNASTLRDEDLIAPALWLAEAANAIWRRVRIGDITADEAHEDFAELLNAPVAAFAIEPLLNDALGLATDLNHPVYDCIYLALAARQNTYVITADNRFVGAAARKLDTTGRVRLLGT